MYLWCTTTSSVGEAWTKWLYKNSVPLDLFGLRCDIASDIVLVDTEIEEKIWRAKEFPIFDKSREHESKKVSEFNKFNF